MKTFFLYLLKGVLVLILAFAGFIAYITITDYRPDDIEGLEVINNVDKTDLNSGDTLSFLTWNLGYAGLGAEMNFFYDGGEEVRPTKVMQRKYLDGIKSFLSKQDSVDFFLLQEIDQRARRSHVVNEVDEIMNMMDGYEGVFAKNYHCQFVPIPVYEPLGYVKGGMLTYSAFHINQAVRYAYPLIAPWPDKLFLLDRCFIQTRYKLNNGKDLVVLNTHNSAYITDSLKRIKELEIIKNRMLEEYSLGNYVIAGGDWNANPPGFNPEGDFGGYKLFHSKVKMKNNTLPSDWKWAFGTNVPTNRQNYQAFKKSENPTTVIDYFVVSPNIQVLQVENIDLGFENSDHQPCYVKLMLSNN